MTRPTNCAPVICTQQPCVLAARVQTLPTHLIAAAEPIPRTAISHTAKQTQCKHQPAVPPHVLLAPARSPLSQQHSAAWSRRCSPTIPPPLAAPIPTRLGHWLPHFPRQTAGQAPTLHWPLAPPAAPHSLHHPRTSRPRLRHPKPLPTLISTAFAMVAHRLRRMQRHVKACVQLPGCRSRELVHAPRSRSLVSLPEAAGRARMADERLTRRPCHRRQPSRPCPSACSDSSWRDGFPRR